MKKGLWTLEGALPVIRQIAAIADKQLFAVALYGSVLREGESYNDLDLFLIAEEVNTTTVHAQTCIDEIVRTLAEVEGCRRGPDTARIQFRDGKSIDIQFFECTALPKPREIV